MGNGHVAADFEISRVRWQFLPEVEVCAIVKFGVSEQEAGLACGPAVPMHDVPATAIGEPFVFIGEIRINKIHGITGRAAIGSNLPKVIIGCRKQDA